MSETPVFQLRGVCKAFGDNVVLQGIDLDVHRGEFLTLIGESGSGKSVVLKAMIGLIGIDAGEILFDGKNVAGLSEREWVEVRRRVGMLFQESALFDSMTVKENVSYGLLEQGTMPHDKISKRVTESLAAVSLPGIEHMSPKDLSGGMQKRVALARAVAMQPEVVLYDEPTEGLDPINVTRVNRLMLGLREAKDITTVVVTHNMKAAFDTSDRIAFLHGGVVACVGTPDELLERNDPRMKYFLEKAVLKLPTETAG